MARIFFRRAEIFCSIGTAIFFTPIAAKTRLIGPR